MKTIFIIGGIGSGKSTVVDLFDELGARVIDLDAVGHEALNDSLVKDKLVEVFGSNILDESGVVIRKHLANRAFSSNEMLMKLNTITFPHIERLMKKQIAALAQTDENDFVVIEASSYNPDKTNLSFKPDYIIAVTAPEEERIKRAVKSGFSEEDARSRNKVQPTDQQRISWADRVIHNDSSLDDLRSQVTSIVQSL